MVEGMILGAWVFGRHGWPGVWWSAATVAVLSIVDRMMKQRKDSIAQFEAGRREDLAAVERAEIAVLQTYLPAQATDAEIDAMIAEAVAATGAAGPAGIGKVMAILKPKLAGRADLASVSARVKARLG